MPFTRVVLNLSLALIAVESPAEPTLQTSSTNSLKQVLIIESFGRNFAPWSAITPAFKKELSAQVSGSIEFHEAALETARYNAPEAELAFAAYLRTLYVGGAPDLVVPIGGPAALFWWQNRKSLFPNAPVVVAGIEKRRLNLLPLSGRETAVTFQFDLHASLQAVLQTVPAITNLAVVLGDSPLERFWVAECQKAWQPFSNRVQFTWFNKLSFAEMCLEAGRLPPRSGVLYGMFFVDGMGVPQEETHALTRLCNAANGPVFGLFEEHIGNGIVGGLLISGGSLGREAARIATRVLAGESPSEIPALILDQAKPIFDWRELQQHGIKEETLPAGSIVRFRQASVWERYQIYILGALGIMALQGITIVSLLAQRARRRRAEENLRESRQFMELATAAGELGLWVGPADGNELWVNAPLRTIFGWDANHKVRWRDFLDRVHPEDRSRAQEAMDRLTRDGGSFEFEGRLVLDRGAEKWIRTKGLGTRESLDKPLRTQGIISDITVSHTAELEAQRHRDEMVHVGRVHILGQMSCALAHEINQPLGAILSNAEAAELLLKNSGTGQSEIMEIFTDIRNDTQRASEVIQKMRSLLRRHELELRPIHVKEFVDGCIELARPNALASRVTLHREVRSGATMIRGDRVQLEQVMLNLLINSMDAMRDIPLEKRQLHVRARNGALDTVEFSVEDNGTGIAPEHLERIFNLFHTTKQDGLGVGLSISRTIIEAHHGLIWAENNPAGGATFRFTLPIGT